jgi:hypothetical protein
MKNMRMLLAGLCIGAAQLAHAGQPCTEFVPTPETMRKALTLAKQAQDSLDESGAEVALIARVGQDLSKYGLRYSHFGFALREPEGKGWTVFHELNQCSTAESGLYREGLGNFFLDDMFAYETLIVVPGRETRRRLVEVLSGDLPAKMHGLPYNMVAYAYSTRYQNSNQWALELIAAASASDIRIASREQAQAWLRAAGFKPITLQIDAMTRLGGRMFKANIAFDDHPFDRRMAGQIDTVTVDSVFRFVEARDAEARRIQLKVQ